MLIDREDAMVEPAGGSFDLVERPWILVHRLDGGVEEVSLREVFTRAGELRSVLGEVPTQSFAIMRLLLAILHRAVDGPPDAAGWAELWEEPGLPVADVSAYLDRFRSRFDLLSAQAPFFQVAGLHTARGEHTGLDRLIADVPAGARFFTTRLGSGVDWLSFAEAARWVVHCQAFDPSGIKSGAVGDPRVKGGRGYPIGTGWAGMLGGVLAEGHSLRETLLLNLIPDDFPGLQTGAEDRPVWEREPPGPTIEFPEGHPPAGPVQLYTWQSRRIRLFHDSEGVYGVLIANGDPMTPQNRFRTEPLSLWRRSLPQEKKSGVVPTYMPRTHDPERAIWRGLEALLQDTWHRVQSKDAAGFLRPAVLNWLEHARGLGLLGDSFQVLTRTIGMAYGPQSSTTAEIIDDAVSVAVVLLGEAGQQLRATAVDAVRDSEDAAKAVGNLAANLAEAAGGDGGGPQERARESVYAELDRPYRQWLSRLGPGSSPVQARARWQEKAYEIARRLGRELVAQAAPVAWRGREVRGRHLSTPEADIWFRRRLRQIFTYADSSEKETTEVIA
jgi:CRISPR system Cascade subunit CasA